MQPRGPARVLVLGGTSEARALAVELADSSSLAVTTSLARGVPRPDALPGDVHDNGFGGADGLADWLVDHHVRAVVDATQPFAARITAAAVTACGRTGVPLVVLDRPGWLAQPGDDWRSVPDVTAAARVLAHGPWRRALLTTGRQGLASFSDLERPVLVVRVRQQPEGPLPRACEVVVDSGPHDLDSERALMVQRRVDVLVARDSGGPAAAAKLVAARELGLPVVVVRRPPVPDHVARTASVADAASWLRDRLA